MINPSDVAEKIYNVLKGFGLVVNKYDAAGKLVISTADARRFAVPEPNIIVRFSPDSQTIALQSGPGGVQEKIRNMLQMTADDNLYNFDFNQFSKTITPRGEAEDIEKTKQEDVEGVMEEINQIRKLAGLEEGWWNRKPGQTWSKSDSRIYEIYFSPRREHTWLMYSYDEDEHDGPTTDHVSSDNVEDIIRYVQKHDLAGEPGFFPFGGYHSSELDGMNINQLRTVYRDVKKLHDHGLATDDSFERFFEDKPPFNRSPESGMQGDMFENWFNRDPQYYSLEWDEVNAEWALTSSKINDQGGDHSHKKHISSYHVKDIIDYVNKHKLDDIGFKRATAYVEDLPRAAGREKRANELKALHRAGIISSKDLGIVLQGSDQDDVNPEHQRVGKQQDMFDSINEGVGQFTVKKSSEEVDPGDPDNYEPQITYTTYDIMHKGKRVGELTTNDYFGSVYGELYGKDLPDIGSYQGKSKNAWRSGVQGQLHAFLKSKTGQKWASTGKLRGRNIFDETVRRFGSDMGSRPEYDHEVVMQDGTTKIYRDKTASGALKQARDDGHKVLSSTRVEENTNMEQIAEGFGAMTGSRKSSYQTLENVKLVVRHKAAVNEESRGSRSRNIKEIYVQRGDERFKLPENNLRAARAMARHVQQGGEVFDTIGESIMGMATEQRKLKEFVRYVNKRGLVNESNQDYVNMAKQNITDISESFVRLAGAKSYANAVETIQARNSIEPLSEDNIQELFTETHFDDRVAEAMDSLKNAMGRDRAFRESVTSAIKTESFKGFRDAVMEADLLSYENSNQQFAQRIRSMGICAESAVLTSFLNTVSSKIAEGSKLNSFETQSIRECMAKVATIKESAKPADPLQKFLDVLDDCDF